MFVFSFIYFVNSNYSLFSGHRALFSDGLHQAYAAMLVFVQLFMVELHVISQPKLMASAGAFRDVAQRIVEAVAEEHALQFGTNHHRQRVFPALAHAARQKFVVTHAGGSLANEVFGVGLDKHRR